MLIVETKKMMEKTKFRMNDLVKAKQGFFKGFVGRIVDFTTEKDGRITYTIEYENSEIGKKEVEEQILIKAFKPFWKS